VTGYGVRKRKKSRYKDKQQVISDGAWSSTELLILSQTATCVIKEKH